MGASKFSIFLVCALILYSTIETVAWVSSWSAAQAGVFVLTGVVAMLIAIDLKH